METFLVEELLWHKFVKPVLAGKNWSGQKDKKRLSQVDFI